MGEKSFDDLEPEFSGGSSGLEVGGIQTRAATRSRRSLRVSKPVNEASEVKPGFSVFDFPDDENDFLDGKDAHERDDDETADDPDFGFKEVSKKGKGKGKGKGRGRSTTGKVGRGRGRGKVGKNPSVEEFFRPLETDN